MRIPNIPGEYAFPALFKNGNGWVLTKEVFFSAKEVMHFLQGYEVLWPVEINDNGAIYVPAQEELGE